MVSSILLLGDIGLDRNLHGSASQLSPEGPYPVVELEKVTANVGCVGNVVHSVIEFFDEVHLFTCLHSDHSIKLTPHLHSKVKYTNIHQQDRLLHIINRILVGNYCVARYDENNRQLVEVDKDNENKMIDAVRLLIPRLDVVVLSDYGKGFLTRCLCEGVIQLCNENDIPVLVDPFLNDWGKYAGCTWIKPNRIIAESVMKQTIETIDFNDNLTEDFSEISVEDLPESKKNSAEQESDSENFNVDVYRKFKGNLTELAYFLLNELKIKYFLCTLDKDGMMLASKDEQTEKTFLIKRDIEPSNVVDVIGCGDSLIAALSVLYQRHPNLISQPSRVVKFLTKVGQVSVSTSGCYHFNDKDYHQIKREVINDDAEQRNENVDKKNNKNEIKREKDENEDEKEKTVVFTNGCFDILHPTHVRLLKKCRSLGSHFIIGINTDSSVRRIKGQGRPVNSLKDRITMLEELNLADKIIPFEEDSVLELIKKIKPDILVKGGDYKLNDIVGHQHVPKTVIFTSPYDKHFSSTRIINKCSSIGEINQEEG